MLTGRIKKVFPEVEYKRRQVKEDQYRKAYPFGKMTKKVLLREFYELCKDGLCQDLLTEAEKAEVANGAMYLTGRMQTAEVKNGNGRRYSRRRRRC